MPLFSQKIAMMKSFLGKFILIMGLVVVLFMFSITVLNDRTSQWLRHHSEQALNGYLLQMAHRADQNALTIFDRFVVHSLVIGGAVVGYPMYPEAAQSLIHCIYGNGEPMEVSAQYFKQSPFIQKEIRRLGVGNHREMLMHQADDWRTSLTFNPYNLRITRDSVELYYNKSHFKPSAYIGTRIPFGRFLFRFPHSPLAALQGPPYRLYARWKREE